MKLSINILERKRIEFDLIFLYQNLDLIRTRGCQVTVHYIPIIDLIIFLLSGRTFSRVTDKPLNKLRVIWNYVKGCVVITSHVVFIYLKNNQ